MSNEVMPDFTTPRMERKFRIDDDIFLCAHVVPAGVGRELARIMKLDPEDQFDAVGRILDMVLLPTSAEVFAGRMTNPENPISMEQIGQVVEWLTKEYGGRPTVPSVSSTPSPMSTGTSLTDGVPLEVSPV